MRLAALLGIALAALVSVPALAAPVAKAPAIMPHTDIRMSTYRNFDLPRPRPAICKAYCDKDPQCQAWSFAAWDTKSRHASCWLAYGPWVAVPSCCNIAGHK